MIYRRVSLWLLGCAFWITPTVTFAALDTNLKIVGGKIETAGESGPKLMDIIGGLINALLSALGVIFVILVVYAGFLWMTAGGEATKVDKAKKLLGQAIIGLVIIVAAYAITTFVIDKIAGATTGAAGAGKKT